MAMFQVLMRGSQVKRSQKRLGGIEMMPTLNERLKEMIAALKNWQENLNDNGYPDSSRLLQIAALDLQMKLHSISDAELAAFCDAIRRKTAPSSKSRCRLSKLGPHFNGSESLAPQQNVVIMRSVKVGNRRKTNNRE